MATILNDIKVAVGVDGNNLGFDQELLILINSAVSDLIQIGVEDFELIEVDTLTEWPVFDSLVILALVKHYMILKTKQTFDPSASETIYKSIDNIVTKLEGRISHEMEEVANVA